MPRGSIPVKSSAHRGSIIKRAAGPATRALARILPGGGLVTGAMDVFGAMKGGGGPEGMGMPMQVVRQWQTFPGGPTFAKVVIPTKRGLTTRILVRSKRGMRMFAPHRNIVISRTRPKATSVAAAVHLARRIHTSLGKALGVSRSKRKKKGGKK